MKKRIISILAALFVGVGSTSIAMNTNTTHAQKIAAQQAYYENIVGGIDGKDVTVISSYDWTSQKGALQKAFVPNEQEHHDIRPLEAGLRSFATERQTMVQRHRGKVGFGAGLLVGASLVAIPLVYVLSCLPRFYK